jgi:hypothetical protein
MAIFETVRAPANQRVLNNNAPSNNTLRAQLWEKMREDVNKAFGTNIDKVQFKSCYKRTCEQVSDFFWAK